MAVDANRMPTYRSASPENPHDTHDEHEPFGKLCSLCVRGNLLPHVDAASTAPEFRMKANIKNLFVSCLLFCLILVACRQEQSSKTKTAVFRLFDLFQPEDLSGKVTPENAGWKRVEWRVAEMARAYPDVTVDKFHIDILTAHFVQRPDFFDVVVASNLFGDILSDLGPACTGTIGIAPSANLNPDRRFPSLFEPVHGSAPDIAGQQKANPIGQIWCGAMLLDFLGYRPAHDAVLSAIEKVLDPHSGAPRTADIGGSASTQDLGRAIAQAI